MKTILSAALAFGLTAGAAHAATPHTQPPKGFVKVSDALKQPSMAWIPGVGTLYIDPATLAKGGPFLGYDKKGQLVNVTYMVPLKLLNAQHDFTNLGTSVMGLKIDHTDITYSQPHPGVTEPHVHVINWLIPHAKELKEIGTYPLGGKPAKVPGGGHHH